VGGQAIAGGGALEGLAAQAAAEGEGGAGLGGEGVGQAAQLGEDGLAVGAGGGAQVDLAAGGGGDGVGAGAAAHQADVEGDAAVGAGLALGAVDEASERPHRVDAGGEVVAGVGGAAGDLDGELAGALPAGDQRVVDPAGLEDQAAGGAAAEVGEGAAAVGGAGLLVGDGDEGERDGGEQVEIGEDGQGGAHQGQAALHVEDAGAIDLGLVGGEALEQAGREDGVVVTDEDDAGAAAPRGGGEAEVIGGGLPFRTAPGEALGGEAGEREGGAQLVGDALAAGVVGGERVEVDPALEERPQLGEAHRGALGEA
jgi:hypothetical protein